MKHLRPIEARRRVELALPAAIAYRLAGIFIPTTPDDRAFLDAAKTVFNAVVMEPVEGLPKPKRESHLRTVKRLQADLLAPYQGRGAVTVYRAAHHWLQDLCDTGAIEIDPEGAFNKCWEALGEAFANDRGNLEAWEACERSALKMAAEWKRWLADGRYYVAEETEAA